MVQVADATFEVLGIPAEIHRFVILLAIAGFPVSLILGWIFDWTADGVVRTPSRDPAEADVHRSRRVDFALAFVATVVIASLLWVGMGGYDAKGESTTTSVVVLPFDDLSSEGDRAYFAEGMSEELTNVLGRLPSLRVFGRTSAAAAKREGMDAARDHENAVHYAARAQELEPGNPVAAGMIVMNLL